MRPRWEERILSGLACLVIAMMLAIVAQVGLSVLDINPVIAFDDPLPVLGRAVTLNSLLDFQWHLLAVVALLPAWLLWRRDRHVRVDFLYQRATDKTRRLIDTVGNLVFAVPFLALSIDAAWGFAMRAYATGEGSRNDGLNDLFLIKLTLPLGLALLAVVVVIDLARYVRGRI